MNKGIFTTRMIHAMSCQSKKLYLNKQEEKMKKQMRMSVLLVTLMLVMAFMPLAAHAEDGTIEVTVAISNTNFADGAWTGELFSTTVEQAEGTTLGDAVKAACDAEGVSVTGATVAEGGFVTDIDGLSSGAAGGYSGWMVTVNDWFNTTGLGALAEDGDLISVQYSQDGMGGDLGSIFFPIEDANNKTLQAITVSEGTLAPEFAAATKEYTLALPKGTTSINVTPKAFNLNYQVMTTIGETSYKLLQEVPVKDGDVISVTVGDPEWPSMNNGDFGTGAENVPAEVYQITVDIEGASNAGLMIAIAALFVALGVGAVILVRRRKK
jgi:hypothetical protein